MQALLVVTVVPHLMVEQERRDARGQHKRLIRLRHRAAMGRMHGATAAAHTRRFSANCHAQKRKICQVIGERETRRKPRTAPHRAAEATVYCAVIFLFSDLQLRVIRTNIAVHTLSFPPRVSEALSLYRMIIALFEEKENRKFVNIWKSSAKSPTSARNVGVVELFGCNYTSRRP